MLYYSWEHYLLYSLYVWETLTHNTAIWREYASFFFIRPADNQWKDSCCTKVKLHSIFSPSLLSQFIRPTWSKPISLDRTSNSSESGWDWITNRGEPLYPSISLSLPPPHPFKYLKKDESKHVLFCLCRAAKSDYFWRSFSVTWTCHTGLPLLFKSIEVFGL